MNISFLQFLSQSKAISKDDVLSLEKEIKESKQSLESLLVKSKKISESNFLRLKSDYYNLPLVDFSEKDIPKSALNLFPKEIIINYQIVPYSLEGDKVRIAMVNPGSLAAREAVDFLARQKGWNIQFYVTTESGFKSALSKYENLSSEVSEALKHAQQEKQIKSDKTKTPAESELEEVVKSAPVSKMVNVIFRHAVEGGASDIHIETHGDESRVRYRIDGKLHTTLRLPKYIHSSLISRIKVLANLKLDETRKPQDGRIHLKLGGKEVDFRISTMPLSENEKAVMRILDITKGAPTLADLGFMGRNMKVISDRINEANGLFLVTGPTGSGKSTTLFSALSVLNKEDVNIVTLEDPIEYYLKGANQSQVRAEVNYTFASGLRSILRQDPDIIMVGEIRDNETVALAIQAALTGHIVFSTLHTNSALGAIPRLLDMKAEAFLLATTINIIVAQRLVRKICEDCKEETKIIPDLEKRFDKIISEIPKELLYEGVDIEKKVFYKGRGCSKCGNSGYKGRVGINEVVENTRNMQKIIGTGFDGEKAREELLEQKFISMIQDGAMKVLMGLTTADEIIVATKE